MRKLLIPNIIASTVLSLGLSAALQAAPQRYESPYQADSRGDLRDGQLLFSRVRADIDRAEGDLPSFTNGRDRFDRVRGELSSLQRHWDESTYEPRNADNVILALNRALDSSGIPSSDRDRLAQDLVQLRDFRDSHL
jgi:hypothetical protein